MSNFFPPTFFIFFFNLCSSIRALCGDDDSASPGVYLRVSDAYEWIRATVCDNSNASPDYLDCPNSGEPQVPTVQPPATPQSPVAFRYDIFNDLFLFEAGIVLEKITGVNTVEIVEYVVPGSLLPLTVLTPDTDLSNQVLLESGALYSFLLVDGEGDGLSTVDGLESLSEASKSVASTHTRVWKKSLCSP